MANTDLWPLAWATLQSLTAHYGPAIDHAAERIGIPFGEWYGWLMAAHVFEPDPVSAARLQRRSAYTSIMKLEQHLMQGVRLELLEPTGAGEYRLTADGRAGVKQLIDTAYAAMTPLHPIQDDQLERLVGFLQRIEEASLAAPEPSDKWGLQTARRYDTGEQQTLMVRLDQYLSDLVAFRDDAHLAAWRPFGVSGPAWELLTLLWRTDGDSLEALHQRLLHRGFSRAACAESLGELVARGWITKGTDTYQIADTGREVREQAEATTDRLFYGPWSCLDDSEIDDLRSLLSRCGQGLDRLRGVSV